MELSIVIVSYKVKGLLRQCLNSIFKQNFYFAFEVIVVDNNSQDNTIEMIKEEFPEVKLVASPANLGFAKANDLGIKQARGGYFLLLNPDTRLIDNSLELALEKIKSDQTIGLLGCKLLNEDKTIQPSVRLFPKIGDHLLMMFKLHHVIPLKKYLASNFDYQKEQTVDQIMGAFMLLSQATLNKIGRLDEKYHIWFEEVDYCWRAKNAGLKVIYFPETAVIHFGGQSFKQINSLKKQWIFSLSRLRFIKKQRNFFGWLLIASLTPLSLLLSAIKLKKWN